MPITLTRRDALPIALVLLIAGCVTTGSNPNCPPPVPRLNWSPAADGGVCVSAESTAVLLDYLDGLARCGGQ